MTKYRLMQLSANNSLKNRKELVKEIKKQGKISTKRISALNAYTSKVGPERGHSFALDKLIGSLESLDLTLENPGSLKSRQNSKLARQLDILQTFNKSITSTPTGIKKQEKLLKQNIRSAGIKVARGSNWERVVEIFSSEAFKEFESFGSSRRFAIAYEAAKRKVTDEDLDRIMQEYKEGMSIDEAWYNSAGFKPLLL